MPKKNTFILSAAIIAVIATVAVSVVQANDFGEWSVQENPGELMEGLCLGGGEGFSYCNSADGTETDMFRVYYRTVETTVTEVGDYTFVRGSTSSERLTCPNGTAIGAFCTSTPYVQTTAECTDYSPPIDETIATNPSLTAELEALEAAKEKYHTIIGCVPYPEGEPITEETPKPLDPGIGGIHRLLIVSEVKVDLYGYGTIYYGFKEP